MKEYSINVVTKDDEVVSGIMRALSAFDCDIHVDKTDRAKRYPSKYDSISFSRLGEKDGRKPSDYKKDMVFFKHASAALESYGLSSKHKGFRYAIECIRLIIVYGTDTYSLNKDVYPIVADWYMVTPACVEHNVRNAIICAWDRTRDCAQEYQSKMAIFASRPTNYKFLDHLAKITDYSLMDATS